MILNADNEKFNFTCVSMGNPHAITFIKEDVNSFDICKYGRILEVDEVFPNKANIEFVTIIDEKTLKMRVWERGAGETLACGTGACGVAVAAILNNYTQRNVTVKLIGGDLEIEWNKEDNHVYMTGPATTVFEGQIPLNKRKTSFCVVKKYYTRRKNKMANINENFLELEDSYLFSTIAKKVAEFQKNIQIKK